jgi:spoIIIJ-associated protein
MSTREDLHETVRSFVEDIVDSMGVAVDVEVEDLEDGSLRVDLLGEDGEVLLRRKGEGLDALQHIVNTAYRRDLGGNQRIVVDAQNFRRGKDQELQQMAQFLMEKVKTGGVPQEMGPLNSYARRMVHLEVAKDPDLESESQGDGQVKVVIISLKSSARR